MASQRRRLAQKGVSLVVGTASMVLLIPSAGLAIDANDPRVTRVGALLRRTSLDELPNLLNVLRGEMSLIGPRPTLPQQVAQYSERQRGRLAIRPGITGWAQVNGRASLPWPGRSRVSSAACTGVRSWQERIVSSRRVAVVMRSPCSARRTFAGEVATGWSGAGG